MDKKEKAALKDLKIAMENAIYFIYEETHKAQDEDSAKKAIRKYCRRLTSYAKSIGEWQGRREAAKECLEILQLHPVT